MSSDTAGNVIMLTVPTVGNGRVYVGTRQNIGGNLPRLNKAERSLFDDLRDNRIRPGLRLEQELVTFGWLKAALDALPER